MNKLSRAGNFRYFPRTDYNKMKKLIQLDKLDGNRKGVLRKITEEGQITRSWASSAASIQA